MSEFNRSSNTSYNVSSAEYDEGLRSYMLKIYNYMTIALALTGLVAFYVSTNEVLMQKLFYTPLHWVVSLAPIGVVIFLSLRVQKLSYAAAQIWFWVFASLVGLSLAGLFMVYTGQDITRAFFITSATFASLSLYGYTTKKDLSGWGKLLFMAVVGIIICSIVNLLIFKSSALLFGISVVSVLVFSAMTAYDTQRLKELYSQISSYDQNSLGKVAIMGALSLYLNFINMFISILQIIGLSRD